MPRPKKPVAQYNQHTGQLVEIHESINKASRNTGVPFASIRLSANSIDKGELMTAGDFVWTFDTSDSFACPTYEQIQQAYAEREAEGRKQRIKTWSNSNKRQEQGEKSNKYWSDPEKRKEQSERISKFYSDPENREKHVQQMKEARGTTRTPDAIDKMKKSKNLTPEQRRAKSEHGRTVDKTPVPAFQYDLVRTPDNQKTLKFVAEHESQNKAGEALGCAGANISCAIRGKNYTARGFVFSDHKLTDQEIEEKCALIPLHRFKQAPLT